MYTLYTFTYSFSLTIDFYLDFFHPEAQGIFSNESRFFLSSECQRKILLLPSFFQIASERLCCIAIFYSKNLIPRACEYKISSFIATFRTNIDNSVSIGDDVEIMFDYKYGVPFFYQSIEDIKELLNIRKMKTGCRFIKNIERLPCRSFGEIKCELDSLWFTSWKCWSRLSKGDIAETDIDENIKNSLDSRKTHKKSTRIFNRHIENFCDIFSLKLNLKSLIVISSSTTRFTFDIDIWKKMHLDFLRSTSFANFTTTSLSIEWKSSRTKSSLLSIKWCCKNFTNICKESRICGDIRMWSSSNRGLIYYDYLVDVRHSFDTLVSTNLATTRKKIIHQIIRKNIDNERWFSWSRYSRDHCHTFERNSNIDIF